MSYKIALFAVALFASQANAQVGGFIRPFITGYTNGISEMAKPFLQLGQSVMSPAAEYLAGARPQMNQWMDMINQRPFAIPTSAQEAQAALYNGYETIVSRIPSGESIVQMVRPKPQGVAVSTRPYPVQIPTQVSEGFQQAQEAVKPYIPSTNPTNYYPSAEVQQAQEAVKPYIPSTIPSNYYPSAEVQQAQEAFESYIPSSMPKIPTNMIPSGEFSAKGGVSSSGLSAKGGVSTSGLSAKGGVSTSGLSAKGGAGVTFDAKDIPSL